MFGFWKRGVLAGFGTVALVLLLLTAGLGSVEANLVEDPPIYDQFIYLPMMFNPPTTIAGKVMNGASHEVNGLVALMDQAGPGTSAYMVANVRTDSAGAYRFSDVPLLRPGHSYFVRFIYQNSNTLFRWETAPIFELNRGQTVILPTFDVAPVILTDPAADSVVTLPYTFRWTPRAGHPDEMYTFYIVDTSLNRTFASPNLGHAGEYSLSAESLTFFPDIPQQFSWYVEINMADGSKGQTLVQNVNFTNSAQ